MAWNSHLDEDATPIKHMQMKPLRMAQQPEGGQGLVDNIHNLDVGEQDEEKAPSSLMRIAVLGATGTGKSTLCNLICGEDEFEVSGGFNSCTEEVKSKAFSYVIEDEKCEFEIVDCPGFFDTDVVLSKMNESEIFNDNIRKCINLTDQGVSAYLLVVPYGRMTAYHAASIEFIQEYFPQPTKKYVHLVITRSTEKTEEDMRNEFDAQRSKAGKATKLLQQFMAEMQGRMMTTECETSVERKQKCRKKILKNIYQVHQQNGGAYVGKGIWLALQTQLEQFEQLQLEQKKQKAKNRRTIIFLGIIVAMIVVGTAYKFYTDHGELKVVKIEHAKLQNEKAKLQNEKTMLQNDQRKLQKEKVKLQNKNGQLQKENHRWQDRWNKRLVRVETVPPNPEQEHWVGCIIQ